MQVKKVDPIRFHARQRSLDRADHAHAVVATGIGIAGMQVEGVFRGQNDALTTLAENVTQDFFRASVGISTSGIHEIAPVLKIDIQHLACFVGSGAPSPIRSKGHGSQRQLGNPQPAVAKEVIFQSVLRCVL
jgi:hypothetical protein